MATIFNVADWFLSREAMPPKKLQKLCYYYKAWGLALYDKDLLPEAKFEAWIHGPVNPELYSKYKGYLWRDIPQVKENSKNFTMPEMELLQTIWNTYGGMSANALEVQTHIEAPWRKARGNISEFETCTTAIKNDDMKFYYRELYESNQGE